jgi:plasmid maintenance system antidote protein VapI
MCYERKRKAGNIPGLVDAAPALDKINVLIDAGWRVNEIARAAHIDRTLIRFIVEGRQRINADTCFAIAAIVPGRRADFIVHIDPKVAKARGRKAAASLTVEVKAERSRKIWVTRHANLRAAKQVTECQRILLSPAEQRARQEVIMARRRRDAEHQRRIAHPKGLVAEAIGELPGSWVDSALCAQTDPDSFFPEKGGSTRDAKKICLGCEVRSQCLAYALNHDERFGIWGGFSERERRRMQRGII